MNKEQIESIFKYHNVATVKSIEKIEIGFSNDVYSINDDFILKVCKDHRYEERFKKEVFLYNFLKEELPIPQVKVYDESKSLCVYLYIIYPKIRGVNLYSKWHLMNNAERKNIIGEICTTLKIINKASTKKFADKFGLNSNLNWEKVIVGKIHESLSNLESRDILSKESIHSIKAFVSKNSFALSEQDVKIVYWDIHFDNVIIEENKLVGLIDFERTELCSIDFVLDVVKRMMDHPKKYVSAEFEKFAVKEDYQNLMTWYKEFYPELFSFKNLDLRLALYSIEHNLSTLIGWPEDKKLEENILNIIQPEETISHD